MRARANKRQVATLRTAALLALTMPLLASCQVEDAEPGLANGVASVHIAEQSVWEWSPDADCSPCHATEAETTTSGLCAAAQEEGNPCLLCHDDTTTLSQTHAVPFDIRGTTRLRNTEVDNDSCTQCHDASSLTAASADGAMLADSNGKSVDPHALPDTESHSSLVCSACHKPHSDTPTAETALETCLSCHHQNVFECNTCHE